MFQFTGLAFLAEDPVFNRIGCPIRKSPDRRLFAPPRSLSQLITSFIASESQGIHRTLLCTFLTICIVINQYLTNPLYFLSWCQRTSVSAEALAKADIPLNTSTLAEHRPPSLKFRRTKWRIRESNPWPLECKSSALANWANSPAR